jgi:hypothetical protein
VLALLVVLASALPVPSASAAEFGIAPGGLAVRAIDAEGNAENLAGAHPDRFQIDFALTVEGTGTSVRDLVFELPPGFGSDSAAVPACPRQLFDAGEEECPPESQVGVLRLGPPGGQVELPLFVVEPRPDEIAAFGSKPGVELPLRMELRPADYGITFEATDLAEVSVSEGQVEMWGVPADHQEGTGIPRRPFLTTPPRCGPLVVTFRVRSWEPEAPWHSASADTGAPLSDCEALGFEPRFGLRLGNPVADSPTGIQMDIEAPGEEDPDGRANAHIEELTADLPPGVTVSPGGAESLEACSDAQLGLGTTDPASCPSASRVGGVEFESPLLREALDGVVYLGEERPRERFRLFIVAIGPGTIVKFVGAMRADPTTGGLSVAVGNLPQVPLSRLTLSMDGGPGALLASPLECGPATATARFNPHSGGAPVTSSVSVPIAALLPGTVCPGALPFAPTLAAASSMPRAGRATKLSMRVQRRDGEKLPVRFALTLPPGLSATVGALERCPEPAASAGACSAGSRIGTAVAEVGSGPDPAALRGDAYLTGPYRGAPFGLLMTFGGTIGPFDLGTIAVRAGLRVNRRSGRVTVLSDRLPAVVEGVQVRFRSIGLDVDRSGFLLNPTSCGGKSVDADIEAMGGASTTAKATLAVRGCGRLGFEPRVSMALAGRSELHRRGNPGLRVSARLRRRDSSLRAMTLSLPGTLRFDLSGIGEICARRDATRGDCPAGSRVGTAIARTPLLSRPLRGAMHIVQPTDAGMPDLWLSVAAMGVQVDLMGETSVRDGRLVIELARLPDIPMSAFAMRTPGGEAGIFSLSAGLCIGDRIRRLVAPVSLEGQSGADWRSRVRLKAKPRCSPLG